jgi:hypothetical protein
MNLPQQIKQKEKELADLKDLYAIEIFNGDKTNYEKLELLPYEVSDDFRLNNWLRYFPEEDCICREITNQKMFFQYLEKSGTLKYYEIIETFLDDDMNYDKPIIISDGYRNPVTKTIREIEEAFLKYAMENKVSGFTY